MHHDDEVKCEKRGMDAQPPKPEVILHTHSDDASRDNDDGGNKEKSALTVPKYFLSRNCRSLYLLTMTLWLHSSHATIVIHKNKVTPSKDISLLLPGVSNQLVETGAACICCNWDIHKSLFTDKVTYIMRVDFATATAAIDTFTTTPQQLVLFYLLLIANATTCNAP